MSSFMNRFTPRRTTPGPAAKLRAAAPSTPAELVRYLRTETVGGAALLVAAAVALVWVNSPLGDSYTALRELRLGPSSIHLDLSLGTWAQDGLLAVFFFVAGLEVKREMVVGELATRRSATLPVVAALGGVVVPAVLALIVGRGAPGMEQAWAIPVATDIAFALGVLALVGSKLPASARVFLLSLAVVDDLVAIAIIAVLFTSGLSLLWVGLALVALAAYWLAQRQRVTSPWLYVPLALFTWYAVHETGVHATLAGVALGLLTRVRTDDGEAESPAVRLEHRIQPFSAAFCVPVFALFAAGIPLTAGVLGDLATDRVALAVVVGLLVGKTAGIFGTAWVAIRLGVAEKPRHLGNRDLFALAVLGGIGFTVSLLIAELGLSGVSQQEVATAKAAVLLSSAVASLVGAVLLLRRGRAFQARRDAPPAGPAQRAGRFDVFRDEDVDEDDAAGGGRATVAEGLAHPGSDGGPRPGVAP